MSSKCFLSFTRIPPIFLSLHSKSKILGERLIVLSWVNCQALDLRRKSLPDIRSHQDSKQRWGDIEIGNCELERGINSRWIQIIPDIHSLYFHPKYTCALKYVCCMCRGKILENNTKLILVISVSDCGWILFYFFVLPCVF